jgi:hypothetical protein
MNKKISIKNYTKWVNIKYNLNLDDEDINNLMFSYGFKFNEEV